MNAVKPGLEMPERIRRLPVCPTRNVPVPWFVAWVDGKPEFRCMDHEKLVRAVKEKLCWVCGDKLGTHLVFVIGPMCSINRVSSEPPCHKDCAEYSAQVCPFLTKPHMVRRENDMPEESREPGGFMIRRNPGATALWGCRKYTPFRAGRGSVLFEIGTPEWVTWWSEGRTATRAEVVASIDSGLPILMAEAEREGPDAVQALLTMKRRAESYLPRVSTKTARSGRPRLPGLSHCPL